VTAEAKPAGAAEAEVRRVIRTPDQRVRVFVSSTLGELSAERQAVRSAVEQLRLTSVMFETGARPHPPRELYRAYLAQSHVFVGVYWQRYGWVAPGEQLSGLEDEYRLAGDRPRLLYIKEPAPDREDRLAGLIQEFQADETASYRRFRTVEELARLVGDDLAVLLSERFEATGSPVPVRRPPATEPPAPLTRTVGRDDELDLVRSILRAGHRLVTVTGTGGVGKTRVAVEAARSLRDEYDTVGFVPLEAVHAPDLVLRAIADRLGARTEGARSLEDTLVEHLGSGRHLLVLDNLEQVITAGAHLAALLGRATGVQVLATSRQALRVLGEREIPLLPLPVPDPCSVVAAREQPAVQLFVDRATAVSPTFTLSEDNVGAVTELCRRLDGLPLAIELAAARSRLLPPQALLTRLDELAPVLVGSDGTPERHRSLRATLDWSYGLLSDAERTLLARLSVFDGGFTLEAAGAVCGSGEADVLPRVASLLDKSLLVVDDAPEVGEPRIRMLETVRAYAAERLAEGTETETVLGRHLDFYRRLADQAQPHLCGPGQREWASRTDAERANLRRAVATALERGADTTVIELVWDTYVYYWIRDAVDEPEAWMQRVSAAGRDLDELQSARLHCLETLTRISRGDYDGARARLDASLAVFRARDLDFEAAVALKEIANVAFVVDGDVEAAAAALEEASRLFETVGHDWGVALVETMLGTVFAVSDDPAAAERHHLRSLARAREIRNEPIMVQALHQLALVRVLEGRQAEATAYLVEALPMVRDGRLQTAASYCLDVLAAVALGRGDVRMAREALTGAREVRHRLGTPVWPTVQTFVDALTGQVNRLLADGDVEPLAADSPGTDPIALAERTLAALT
jgi:predicted ATPase